MAFPEHGRTHTGEEGWLWCVQSMQALGGDWSRSETSALPWRWRPGAWDHVASLNMSWALGSSQEVVSLGGQGSSVQAGHPSPWGHRQPLPGPCPAGAGPLAWFAPALHSLTGDSGLPAGLPSCGFHFLVPVPWVFRMKLLPQKSEVGSSPDRRVCWQNVLPWAGCVGGCCTPGVERSTPSLFL